MSSTRLRFAATSMALVMASTLRPLAIAAEPPAWVARSNANAQLLLATDAAFAPEAGSQIGAPDCDERTLDLDSDVDGRWGRALDETIVELEARREGEEDPRVRQDLDILLDAARLHRKSIDVRHRLEQPFISPARLVFEGMRVLLDEQSPPERHKAALVRLRRYAGLEPGSRSVFQLAMERYRERAGETGLLQPFRGLVEKELAESPTYVDGVRESFERSHTGGFEEALAVLRTEAAKFAAFMRDEVLPRTRTDSRLPPELYALELEGYGVDMPAAELAGRARAAFVDIQTQMQSLAPRVAKEKGWKLTDYRDVIRNLKKRQLHGQAILEHYRHRIHDLEDVIRRETILTLPERPMEIALASEAESAAIPAPHMRSPRLLGNTGERGVFVLPLTIPGPAGSKVSFDDFTFEAASWTLTAHEGRPGHELQFARLVEEGISIARAVYAFNSVNVEGWALYAEAEAQPYEPLDGQLIALQHRLMRAARAMLDPALQAGAATTDDAFRVLRNDVVLSQAMAQQEVDRYTFVAPGQATSYFVGYTRLLEIRARAQVALGDRFDRQRFNDFVIGEGLIPPRLLAAAVESELLTSP